MKKNYVRAEGLLLDALSGDSAPSGRRSEIFAFLGGVYFLAGDFSQAVDYWDKSNAIASLQPDVRFSLAMAYIHLHQPKLAEKEISVLRTEDSTNPLYPYWLGRLQYDAQAYDLAITFFNEALRLDSSMAKAYDNLGLCYFYLNENNLAIANYRKAIILGNDTAHPSAWPYLNLGVVLRFINHPIEAESALQRAIQLDFSLSLAHFELGNLLEQEGRLEDAVKQHKIAAQIDPTYSQPHYALARIYRKLGDKTKAEEEVGIFLRLKPLPELSLPVAEP